ncbi:unnamed protein product [Strongylus vulgaris]|uniref:ShKT domain-containing protein n=1 Tax=Strongylus vulgaris TaxID=40348 RepID=A0A3P7IQI9_STRVU|nr:unnamed protein product [Strongylus vulgaris]
MRIVLLLVALVAVSISDLPSCERARCDHCNVEFIARMCEKTCSTCPRSSNRVKLYSEQSRSPLPTTITYVANQQNLHKNVVRQAGVSTQLQQPVLTYNTALTQAPRPLQLAAPQTQVAPIQYPAPTGISTLAPLIPPPRPTDINRNLAQQPADLAQPLPEYQQGALPYNQPQTTQLQLAPQQQQQLFPGAANSVQQSGMTDIFGRPLFPSQSPQSSPFFNPFQPFMPQVPLQATR